MPDEREAAVAYPGRQSTFARLLAALVLAALGIMLLSNVFFRDYKVGGVLSYGLSKEVRSHERGIVRSLAWQCCVVFLSAECSCVFCV